MKKLFVVSDVHGFYAELIKALEEAGFDPDNSDHIFVSCGDLWDRGPQNLEVFNFVRGLKNKILIKGNHEEKLCEVLSRGIITTLEVWNGSDITVRQLLGEDAVDEDGLFDPLRYSARISEIYAFVGSMRDYYEYDKYVFTHGWLPVKYEGNRPYVDPDWRSASSVEWHNARTLEWQQLYGAGALLEDKIIVCGHRPSMLAHSYDISREYDCCDIFYANGMIAIDSWSVHSKRVNVLVIDGSSSGV